jgi:hypothetical protein
MSQVLRIFGPLLFLGMLAASFGVAKAAQIQLNTGSPYKCIAVDGGDTANGTPVILYSCSGGPEDRWNYVQWSILPPNQIYLVNSACASCGWSYGLCLDRSGGPTVGGGTQLVVNPCTGGSTTASQTWVLR